MIGNLDEALDTVIINAAIGKNRWRRNFDPSSARPFFGHQCRL